LEGTAFKRHCNSFSDDEPGPVLDPVGGEFQLSFAIGYPGSSAHLILVLSPEQINRHRIYESMN
jgi:hypothetical protein